MMKKISYLEIAKLSELFSAIIQLARKRFYLLMHDFMCSNIAALSECLSTDVALVWSFSSVASLVCLPRRVSNSV